VDDGPFSILLPATDRTAPIALGREPKKFASLVRTLAALLRKLSDAGDKATVHRRGDVKSERLGKKHLFRPNNNPQHKRT